MTSLVNFARWSRACIDFGVAPDESDYRRVRRSWRGMGRHYHTLSHLEACLREFDDARGLAMRPAEVEFALWFHDVIYRSWRRDNELQSAALADSVPRPRIAWRASANRFSRPSIAKRISALTPRWWSTWTCRSWARRPRPMRSSSEGCAANMGGCRARGNLDMALRQLAYA